MALWCTEGCSGIASCHFEIVAGSLVKQAIGRADGLERPSLQQGLGVSCACLPREQPVFSLCFWLLHLSVLDLKKKSSVALKPFSKSI